MVVVAEKKMVMAVNKCEMLNQSLMVFQSDDGDMVVRERERKKRGPNTRETNNMPM